MFNIVADIGTYPFRYLGIPMHHRKLRNVEWGAIKKIYEETKYMESQTLTLWGAN